MQLSRGLTIGAAVLVLALLIAAGYILSQPRGPIVVDAEVGSQRISPNADGDSDLTTIRYRIRQDSRVSIYFEDASGERFTFRRDEPRSAGNYEVLFGGVVEGFVAEGESVEGEVVTRLLPDGVYTWVIEATNLAASRTDRATGTLTVENGDLVLPDIWEFSISPTVFTPNRDGIGDRVWINVALPKPAHLIVYLIDAEGNRYFIPENQRDSQPETGGRHTFEYEGGVDQGANPPEDGLYTVLVEAEDDEGQRVRQSGELTIAGGGVPFAEIAAQPVGDTVTFSDEVVVLGDVLYFELTVANYGDAPIRTTGPEPGTVYEQNARAATLGWYDESGAWRVGIDCDTCMSDYPWRWAVGTRDELTAVEVDGQTQYYLMPGQRVVVHGGIRLTEIVEARNPQQFWAGLIHEDVGIAPLNNRVDPHWIEIVERGEN